ncbi:zinc ribbon domain-containing protein [Lacrimispora sp. NSJ-141]|uniref:Zinc ribbon domain-containing protein n=1 Tax=Lientehia hominis TaxID=2897778 RepID=A0AAP2W7G6_9FIRM|nr:zinc ribbon domain-containing protein [Lientehia hominis]MCD2492403.1 zinc ribbon domain-containing protein [Lientehia hominis]
MVEMRCMECGEVLSEGMSVCPKCGCPVSQPEREIKAEDRDDRSSYAANSNGQSGKIKIMPIISLIIGVVIVILGFTVLSHKEKIEIYDAKTYNVDKAAFGGDFYTEIYGASDTIVDELSDINGGIASLSNSFVAVVNMICYGSGMIIIALGLGVISVSIVYVGKAKK